MATFHPRVINHTCRRGLHFSTSIISFNITINIKANQAHSLARLPNLVNAPTAGGRIHVIDGVLDWTPAQTGAGQQAKLLDIMDTLKQCDKFDGFVTLAEGTGLTQILKQGKF